MRRIYPILFLAVFFLLGASKCSDNTAAPVKIYCSIKSDGSQFMCVDNSLSIATMGRPFYVNEDMIVQLGDRLSKREPGGSLTNLSPDGLSITDHQYLAIDHDRHILYFSGNYSIYQVGFNGENCSQISPTDGLYTAPALSSCGNYLTAIRDQQIARMNLQTGEWIVLPSPVTAFYATYIGETGEYYFFSRHVDHNMPEMALCKLSAQQDSTQILFLYDSDIPKLYNAQCSPDFRYFAMHRMIEPRGEWGFFSSYWTRFNSDLQIYDRQTQQSFTIPNCYSYSFSPDQSSLLYSRDLHGMSDLMRLDLASRTSTTIWDGFVRRNHYSYSTTEIFPLETGQKIHLQVWERKWREED
ncbi:MAG: hypothetical protein V3576_07455 [Candidatus Cloacimonadota bacterium]